MAIKKAKTVNQPALEDNATRDASDTLGNRNLDFARQIVEASGFGGGREVVKKCEESIVAEAAAKAKKANTATGKKAPKDDTNLSDKKHPPTMS